MNITFMLADGTEKTVSASIGDRLLNIAQNNGLPMEGTCEGHMACATCHIIVAKDWYISLPAPSNDELDMLDFAPGITGTSRLACQIILTDKHDGLRVKLPKQL